MKKKQKNNQIEGIPMGSPLSLALTNSFTEHFGTEALEDSSQMSMVNMVVFSSFYN